MRYIVMILMSIAMLAGDVHAQGRRVVTSDGTNLYVVTTNAGVSATGVLYLASLKVGNLSITTNGISVTNNFKEEDLRFPAQAIRGAGASSPSYSEMFDGLYAFSFSKTSKQTIEGVAQFTHTWDNGDIEPHLHINYGTYTNGGTSVWSMVWTSANIQGALSTITHTQTVTNVWIAGTNWQEDYVSFGQIGYSLHQLTNVSGMVIWNVSRETGDAADTADSTVWLHEFDIHYHIKYVNGEDP